MRFALSTIITLLSINPSLGQAIEKILLVFQEADEPPIKPGPAEYTMAYEINSDEDFIATEIRGNTTKGKLSEVTKIEKQRIDRIAEWDAVKKVDFTMLDLGIDRMTIESAAKNSNYKLNFGLLMK